MSFLPHQSDHVAILLLRNSKAQTFLVAQWIRMCLPMQGTRVQSVLWEDSTSWGATKPMHHNHWAHALEHASLNYWACKLQRLKPMHLESAFRNKRSHRREARTPQLERSPRSLVSRLVSLQLEKAWAQQWRPSSAQTKQSNKQKESPRFLAIPW